MSGSGILYRCSFSALTFQAVAVNPKMTSPIIAVFDFQFAGCEYHPPAGDQTCLGYLIQLKLLRNKTQNVRYLASSTHCAGELGCREFKEL